MLVQEVNDNVTGSQLSSTQKQRYDAIFPIYGEDASLIVKKLSGKSRKSWSAFLQKMHDLMKAKSAELEYYDGLYEAFELGVDYTPSEVIGIVGEVRRDLELDPYVEKIKVQSERDFHKLFVCEDVYDEVVAEDGKIKKKVVGFKPVYKVKPEDN